MDFAKLNPWNWLKKEDEQTVPVGQSGAPSPQTFRPGQLEGLHSEIDRMFDNVFRNFGLARPALPGFKGGEVFKPRVDITGSEKEYVISAELPGIDEKDISIELRGDTLVIKAEKRQEEKSEDKGYYRVERNYGLYQRMLAVPDDADVESVKAAFKNGVVTVTLGRKPAVQPPVRKISLE